MQGALDQFRANLDRVRSIHQLYLSLSASVTPVLDLSDLLRAEIVLIVSALDHFIHEVARQGMLDVWRGSRQATPAFERFGVSLNTARLLTTNATPEALLDAEIRTAHGWKSFQKPDSIADAIRLFSQVELWREVAAVMQTDAKDLKARVELIVDRRNKIAHEADLDPSFPGQRWSIDRSLTEDALEFVQGLGEAIFATVA